MDRHNFSFAFYSGRSVQIGDLIETAYQRCCLVFIRIQRFRAICIVLSKSPAIDAVSPFCSASLQCPRPRRVMRHRYFRSNHGIDLIVPAFARIISARKILGKRPFARGWRGWSVLLSRESVNSVAMTLWRLAGFFVASLRDNKPL